MRVKKVINNNILCAIDEKGNEMIVTGRGLGFKRKVGERIDSEQIEKTYRMEGKAEQRKLRELVEQILLEHLRVTQELIDYIKTQISQSLNESLLITLSDHISFAIKRREQGIEFKNPLTSAIMSYYPVEYQLGQYCLRVVERECGIRLNNDEASFIALHIVNAELNTNMSEMYDITKLLEDCVRVTESYYHQKMDENSLGFNRFIIHLCYLLQWLLQNQNLETLGDEKDFVFQQLIEANCEKDYGCAKEIAAYIEEYYGKKVSKDEYRQKTGVGVAGGEAVAANFDEKSATILIGVGGVANLVDIDCCATRLRLTLVDSSKVDEGILKSTGASGVVVKGAGIQVIYGPSVTIVKSNFEEFVEQVRSGAIPESSFMDSAPTQKAAAPEPEKPSMKDSVLGAHMNGQMLLMVEVKDDAFASCALGDGVAIEPSEGKLYAPADGVIQTVFDTKHAIGIMTDDGAEVLLHVGIDTVKLGGKYFETHVEPDQRVKKGDLLVSFDMKAIKAEGYLCTTPMIICNTDSYAAVKPLATGTVKQGQNLLEVRG